MPPFVTRPHLLYQFDCESSVKNRNQALLPTAMLYPARRELPLVQPQSMNLWSTGSAK